ncbi:MAG TPA: hemolysin family protein [Flavobacteriales bacterium]
MEIVIILILILVNGIFSMSEIALVSARKSRLESEAKRGSESAKTALNLANSPNKFLSTVQIGITLIGILTGIYSGENLTEDLRGWFMQFPGIAAYANSLAVIIVLVCITYFSLLLGELVPKRIGLNNPEGIAKLVARPMQIISVITAPFVWFLTFSTEILLKLLRIKPSADNKVTEEEIKAIVQEGTEDGEVQVIEQDIVERVFTLGDRRVGSLMTYRSEVVFLDVHASRDEVRAEVIRELHSVYPVFEEEKDNVIGIVLLKDLFEHIDKPDFHLKKIIRTPQYLSSSALAYDALTYFKETKVHYGIVTDEYGTIQGIVTMNDILESLVGDVSEFYQDEFQMIKRDDGSYLVDGQYPFYDFLNHFELEELAAEYVNNTVAGLILHQLNSIPKAGDKMTWLNFEFEVVDMDGARIDKIIVRQLDS